MKVGKTSAIEFRLPNLQELTHGVAPRTGYLCSEITTHSWPIFRPLQYSPSSISRRSKLNKLILSASFYCTEFVIHMFPSTFSQGANCYKEYKFFWLGFFLHQTRIGVLHILWFHKIDNFESANIWCTFLQCPHCWL